VCDQTTESLVDTFNALPPSIKQICGNVVFPQDNGPALLRSIQKNKNTMLGTSDAALKKRRATHAWILSSGMADIEDNNMHISGSGPVNGYIPDLSSGRGELHGITALTIMVQEHTPLCPRCNATVETSDHFFTCPATDAINTRQK